MPPKRTSTAAADSIPTAVEVAERKADVIDLNTTRTIGVREHSTVIDAPVIVKDNAGHTGTGKIMEIRQTVKNENLAQPFLTEAEAKQLGVQRWHPYKYKIVDMNKVKHEPESLMCCIVNERRFFISKQIYNNIDHN